MFYNNQSPGDQGCLLQAYKKMIFNRSLLIGLSSLLFSLASLNAGASVITGADGQSVIFEGADGALDRFIVEPPNASHISFNALNSFSVDRDLQVFNLPDGENPAADTVILYTDEANLAGRIEIVGPPSDLVILVKAPAAEVETLSCNHCEFLNVNRVTLAIVKPELMTVSTDMTALGTLSSVANSTMSITGLNAPGALSLEVLVETLDLSGEINLNQAVSNSSSAVYASDINGFKSVGTGAVNLYLGWSNWNYEQREIIGVLPGAPKTLSLNGSIKAPSVRVASSFPLAVNTSIDSRTDLLGTVMYQGSLVAVDENVVVEAIGSNVSLTLNGQFYSEGSLDARASNDIVINPGTYAKAKEIKLIAVDQLLNDGSLDADDIFIAADDIENEGSFQSKGQVYAVAENYLVNQYGGVIRADDVRLESKNGLIRNGSKTPYKSAAAANTNLLTYSSDYINTLSDIMMGAFYHPGVDVNTTSTNYVMAADNSANIIANTITIKSAAFENINPYYVLVDAAGQVILNRNYVDQILVSAEQSLAVDAGNYILNSSAQMIVNSETGVLSLKAALLNNERYRVETTFSKTEATSQDEGYFGPVDITTDTLGIGVGVFSPPGMLSSMGDFRVQASQSLLNNTAYIEVFGDAYVDSPTVSSLGVVLHRFSQSTSSVYSCLFYGSHLGGYCGPRAIEGEVQVDGRQLDTLFFVQGTFNAAGSIGWYSNHKPLETYAAQTAEMLAVEDLGLVLETVVSEGDPNNPFNPTIDLTDSYTQQLSGENLETLQISWTDESVRFLYNDFIGLVSKTKTTDTGTATYDLKDALERYYTKFKDLFINIYNEVNFWD